MNEELIEKMEYYRKKVLYYKDKKGILKHILFNYYREKYYKTCDIILADFENAIYYKFF